MFFMEKEIILQRLQKHWEYAISQGIQENQIVGIFLYGSQNYGFANRNSDVDSKLIIVPTFDELCLQKEWTSKCLHYEEEHIEVKDIRELLLQLKKQNMNFIELLYTNYFIMNPKFASLWKSYFVNNREIISHYSRQQTVKSMCGCALSCVKNKNMPIDNKKLYNAYRIYYFLEQYVNNKVYLDCMQPEDSKIYTFLWDLKFKLSPLSVDEPKKVNAAMRIEQKLKDFQELHKNLDSPFEKDANDIMCTGVMEIMKLALENPQEETTKDIFFQNLTKAEQKAYYSIIKEIHAEGNISIKQLIDKNTISRPVYNNLLTKMKNFNVAEIANQGMKGTYIKIIQPELRVEAIDF